MPLLKNIMYRGEYATEDPEEAKTFFDRFVLIGRKPTDYVIKHSLKGIRKIEIEDRGISNLHMLIVEANGYYPISLSSRSQAKLIRECKEIPVKPFFLDDLSSEIPTKASLYEENTANAIFRLTEEDNSLIAEILRTMHVPLKNGDQIELAKGAFTAEFYIKEDLYLIN